MECERCHLPAAEVDGETDGQVQRRRRRVYVGMLLRLRPRAGALRRPHEAHGPRAGGAHAPPEVSVRIPTKTRE